MLLEFDRIIGKDRIEIVLCIVWKLELFLFSGLLPLSLYNLCPALYSFIFFVEETVVFEEVQYHWGLEVRWTQDTCLLVEGESLIIIRTLGEVIVIDRVQEA